MRSSQLPKAVSGTFPEVLDGFTIQSSEADDEHALGSERSIDISISPIGACGTSISRITEDQAPSLSLADRALLRRFGNSKPAQNLNRTRTPELGDTGIDAGTHGMRVDGHPLKQYLNLRDRV